jgi:ADP-ribose pyrophosphatase YjhB (NUDIX family)
MTKRMPAEMFVEVFGNYVPRLCVDTAVIGPADEVCLALPLLDDSFVPYFKWLCRAHGVALKKRNEKPRLGQWGLPGGTIFKGESIAQASKRIIRVDLGVEIDVLGCLGFMEFPNEKREMEVNGVMKQFVIDSVSIVMLARARSEILHPHKAKAQWFRNLPPVQHEYHTPFLVARGLLPTV